MVKESFYKGGDGFVSTTTFDDAGILSSDYIIQRILTALNLKSVGASTYQTSISQNGTVLRVRISNHGVNLSTWYAKNKDEIVPLKDSNNVAITILPNRQECEREKIPFPPKAINKTKVNTSKDSKTPIPQSENFTVEHFCYESWKMDENAINLVITAIKEYMVSGQYVDPLNQQGNKATHFSDTSNQPPKKIKEAKTIKLTEPDLRIMVKECVRRILNESKKHYNIEKIGKWDRIPSNGYEFHMIPGKGTCVGLMMYVDSTSKIEIPPIYCLFRRGDNGKYFYATIVASPEDGPKATKFLTVPLKELPEEIYKDRCNLSLQV